MGDQKKFLKTIHEGNCIFLVQCWANSLRVYCHWRCMEEVEIPVLSSYLKEIKAESLQAH